MGTSPSGGTGFGVGVGFYFPIARNEPLLVFLKV